MDRKALEQRQNDLYAQQRFDETGHRRLRAPRPGDWLDEFTEPGQDDLDYRRECRNKRKRGRETIYLAGLGDLGPHRSFVEGPLASFVCAFFGLEVGVADPVPLPKDSYVSERDQWDGAALLTAVARTAAKDALASIAVLSDDIFCDDLEFVFGLGDPHRRAALVSLHRLASEATPAILQRRARLLACHEVGHVLGMQHCVFYECLMNGTNSLEEADHTPLRLCPVCLAKLVWNVELDLSARDAALSRLVE